MGRRRQKKRPQKAEPRGEKRGRRLRRAAVVFVGVALVPACLAAGLLLSGLVGGGSGPRPRTAVIVDQLSLTFANPSFAETATDILEQAGYAVDYFPGEQVTVELFRNLATYGYDLIILRVHSGLVEERDIATGNVTETEYVSLFTGEPYDETKHAEEVRGGPLGIATYYDGGPQYFGIGPTFIKSSMKGKFDDTTVILMGCDGLRSHETAEAFLDRGARAFVGWSGPVSAAHTDAATERLLEKLLIEAQPIGDAIAQTAAEVGPDPSYGAELRVLPEGG
jgi:hypothetical protein